MTVVPNIPTEGTPPADARDAALPEKFTSVADLAKAYAELERKQSATPPTTAAAPGTTETPPVNPGEAEARTTAQAAGVDYDALRAELTSTGLLSAETYAKLEAAGIPKGMVDSYVEGQKSIAAAASQRITSHVGGQAALDAMLGWARSGLSDADKATFNATMDAGDEGAIKLALDGLRSRYVASVGQAPSVNVTGDTAASTASTFADWHQVTTAMADPRYNKDSTYTAAVVARLAASHL